MGPLGAHRTQQLGQAETPGEGAASGRESRHSGGGGTARYGTVRHGTGSLRVAQSTADTHTVTMFRGSAPGIALTAGNGAQPRSALGLCTPRPPGLSSRLPQLGLGARPGGGAARPRAWQARRQGGRCAGAANWPRRGSRSRVRFTHCTSIYSARSGGAGSPREAPQALHLSPAGRGGGCCPRHPRPTATAAGLPPALGTGRAPGEGSATKRGLPEAAGSSITSA
ncbi:PREDICTED: translation initiation factor IF-2-like [Ficedula albicollis]|uniref:translation initiation factor IF-2-like n=1 Tax=Ficedula albicollis TaxID=59894 RepID=UPI0003599418|nr:PREDICTED: translation initiation factor IF-2-like [Ficedula albicollis]